MTQPYDKRGIFYVSAVDLSHRDKPLRFFFGDEMEVSQVLEFMGNSDWEVKDHGPADFVLGHTLVREITHLDTWKHGEGWSILKSWGPYGMDWRVHLAGGYEATIPIITDDDDHNVKQLANKLGELERMDVEDLVLEVGRPQSAIPAEAVKRYISWRLKQWPTGKRATPSK